MNRQKGMSVLALVSIVAAAVLAIAIFTFGVRFETIPPAHVGKILTTAGYKPDLIKPKKVTLWGRDRLVLLQTGTSTFKEGKMKVPMSDRLVLQFDVRGRVRVNASNKEIINAMFDEIVPTKEGGLPTITLTKLYNTYGKMLVREIPRATFSQYSMEDAHLQYPAVSGKLYKRLREAFEATPLELAEVSLGAIQYPDVITQAVEAQKKRELEIKKAEADAEVKVKEAEGRERVAQAEARVRLRVAQTIKEENDLIAKSVTPEYLAYRRLEVMEKMAIGGNTVFMPFEAMSSDAAQLRMFLADPKSQAAIQ